MEEIEVYTRAVVTILGIAYPILLQVIARLDEKYSSILIVELFDNEFWKKSFKILLISSLFSILIWSFKLPPQLQFQNDQLNYLLSNSASLLVIINTIALIFVFFLYVNKIIIYYTPSKFISYLIKWHNKKSPDLRYFNALSDVFIHSVKKSNDSLSLTILRFYYDAFKQEREKFKSKPVIYPEAYYLLIHKTIEEIVLLKDRKNLALENATVGGNLLLGSLEGYEISQPTYSWFWANILLPLKFDQDDLILTFWRTAHQYISYELQYKQAKYVQGTLDKINTEEIEKRKIERAKFLEFHYALGGLLIYKEKYSCIARMFRYTTSEPPRYELLPQTMDEIFKKYVEYRSIHDTKHMWISSIYKFPGQEGLNADGVVKKWICSYLAVLFLRQYTIYPYLSFMKPLANPSIPNTQGEKKALINNLDFFKKLVSDALQNEELIKKLNFDFINQEWCRVNNKPYPTQYIDNLKASLEDAYNQGQLNLVVSQDKIAMFNTASKEILEKTLNKYLSINNTGEIPKNDNSWFVNGGKMLQDKDAFAEIPEVHHLNFDTFFAQTVSNKITDGIASTFLFNNSKSYLFKQEEIFNAVEKFGLNEEHIIINFGINLSYFIDFLKIKGLTFDNFYKTPILNYNRSTLFESSIFLVRKSNLPNLILNEISSELQEKYSLEKISNNFNLYAKVIDLNISEIRNELMDEKSEEELRKSVLVYIELDLEIRWKKNIPMVQLIEYSEYRQSGLPNSLNDIIKLEV